jgi:2-alkenal reductase
LCCQQRRWKAALDIATNAHAIGMALLLAPDPVEICTMKLATRSLLIISVFLVLVTATACGGRDEVTTPIALAPTVDVAALADTVTARVQAQLPEQVTAIDAEALRTTIQAVLEERLPAVDTQAIEQLVNEAVTARLAQIDERMTISQAAGGDLQATLVALYQQANPAVVFIITATGSGSGFVYDTAGHIVTNRHVVSGSRSFEIVFAGGDRLAAQLVGADADSDLAVLKVAALPASVEPLPLAEADSLLVGQFVVAIGNPFGEQGSMSVGIVSGLGRSLRSQRQANAASASTYSLPGVIQTDAPINPGNSGGPLLNLAGAVVGVNSAIASTTGVNSGVGFSIPVAAVHRVVPSLIEEGFYTYSYMGASFYDEITLEAQSQFGLPQLAGAYVIGVTAGSPAAETGLRVADPNNGRGGDLIVAIDGQPIQDFADLNSYLVFRSAPGQTIDLTVLRDGEEITLPLTLGERP